MTVVASCLYRNGHRVAAVPLDQAKPPKGKGEFIWIGLHDPTSDELETVRQNFNLHPLALKDSETGHQVPKAEIFGDQLFCVMRTANLDGDQIVFGQTSIFVGRHHIITVRLGSNRGHLELRSQLELTPNLLRHGTDYVLYAILDFVVDGYFPILQTIEDSILEMEQQLLEAPLERQQITRIFGLRREMILFQRVLGPTTELCSKLVTLDFPNLDAEAKPYYRDVYDHAKRAQGMATSMREVLTSVFEASNLLEQQSQGQITRQLAAWAAILAVPTAIAGVYGMNFDNMPELKTRYGYFVVLTVIASVCYLLYRRFKKLGWL